MALAGGAVRQLQRVAQTHPAEVQAVLVQVFGEATCLHAQAMPWQLWSVLRQAQTPVQAVAVGQACTAWKSATSGIATAMAAELGASGAAGTEAWREELIDMVHAPDDWHRHLHPELGAQLRTRGLARDREMRHLHYSDKDALLTWLPDVLAAEIRQSSKVLVVPLFGTWASDVAAACQAAAAQCPDHTVSIVAEQARPLAASALPKAALAVCKLALPVPDPGVPSAERIAAAAALLTGMLPTAALSTISDVHGSWVLGGDLSMPALAAAARRSSHSSTQRLGAALDKLHQQVSAKPGHAVRGPWLIRAWARAAGVRASLASPGSERDALEAAALGTLVQQADEQCSTCCSLHEDVQVLASILGRAHAHDPGVGPSSSARTLAEAQTLQPDCIVHVDDLRGLQYSTSDYDAVLFVAASAAALPGRAPSSTVLSPATLQRMQPAGSPQANLALGDRAAYAQYRAGAARFVGGLATRRVLALSAGSKAPQYGVPSPAVQYMTMSTCPAAHTASSAVLAGDEVEEADDGVNPLVGMPDGYLSWSRMYTLSTCPRALWLEKTLGVPGTPNAGMRMGAAVHDAIAHVAAAAAACVCGDPGVSGLQGTLTQAGLNEHWDSPPRDQVSVQNPELLDRARAIAASASQEMLARDIADLARALLACADHVEPVGYTRTEWGAVLSTHAVAEAATALAHGPARLACSSVELQAAYETVSGAAMPSGLPHFVQAMVQAGPALLVEVPLSVRFSTGVGRVRVVGVLDQLRVPVSLLHPSSSVRDIMLASSIWELKSNAKWKWKSSAAKSPASPTARAQTSLYATMLHSIAGAQPQGAVVLADAALSVRDDMPWVMPVAQGSKTRELSQKRVTRAAMQAQQAIAHDWPVQPAKTRCAQCAVARACSSAAALPEPEETLQRA